MLERDPSLVAWEQQCKGALREIQKVRLLFKAQVAVPLRSARSYIVKVFAEPEVLPASRDLGGKNPNYSELRVECRLGMALQPVGDGLAIKSVNAGDGAVDAGFAYQVFDERGLLEWSWDIEGRKYGRQEFRIALRPSTYFDQGIAGRLDGTLTVYQNVETSVEASALERGSVWVSAHVKPFAASLAAILGLIIALFANWNEWLAQWDKFAARRRGTVKAGAP